MPASKPERSKPCGNPECSVSSGVHEGLTFGSGRLDSDGYWEFPCAACARAYEAKHPGRVEWPFPVDVKKAEAKL